MRTLAAAGRRAAGSTSPGPAGTSTPRSTELPGLLAEHAKAPSVEPGSYDLVIDPTNLWLTIHESIGHATELDRALGYEAAYAGTSFATPDKLHTLRYGSEVMNVTGDRTIEHGLATIGYDDEGVATQQLRHRARRRARRLPAQPAHGAGQRGAARRPRRGAVERVRVRRLARRTSRCSGWPNVSLQPRPGRPVARRADQPASSGASYVKGDKSWSIDMQRFNFQFTGQQFHRIENGRLVGQLRDVAYQATTTDFWGVDGRRSAARRPTSLGGALNCGKGQPGQIAPVSHGCPAALFRGVNVLNTRTEGSRRRSRRAQEIAESRARRVDRRRLRGDHRRAQRDQPAVGGERVDHQRPDDLPLGHGHLDVRAPRRDERRGGHPVGRHGSTRSPSWSVPRRSRAATPSRPTTPRRSSRRTTSRPRRRTTDWGADAQRTDVAVFDAVTPALGRRVPPLARLSGLGLYGFAEHQLTSYFLATSTGVRRRFDQPDGRLEINGKSGDLARSAWSGQHTEDFADVDVEQVVDDLRRAWTGPAPASTCRRAATRPCCHRRPSPT